MILNDSRKELEELFALSKYQYGIAAIGLVNFQNDAIKALAKKLAATISPTGDIQLETSEGQKLATSLHGVNDLNTTQEFCTLAAHIKWQIDARPQNKLFYKDFLNLWENFKALADKASK